MTVYRVGRKVGRTVYRQIDERQPSDGDELVGLMDTRELAAFAVEAMNAQAALRSLSVLLADLVPTRTQTVRSADSGGG